MGVPSRECPPPASRLLLTRQKLVSNNRSTRILHMFFAIYYLQQYNMRTASVLDRTIMFSPQGRQKLYTSPSVYKLTSKALPSLTTPLLTQRSVSHLLFLYFIF